MSFCKVTSLKYFCTNSKMLQDGAEENVELWSSKDINTFQNVWFRVTLPIPGKNPLNIQEI